MGETTFSLAFGTKAVIPIELGVPSVRIANFDEQTNFKRWLANLDLLEARERAHVRMVAYRQKVVHYFNSKVQIRHLRSTTWCYAEQKFLNQAKGTNSSRSGRDHTRWKKSSDQRHMG